MAFVNVFPDEIINTSATDFRVVYSARNSLGQVLAGSLQVSGTNRAISQVIAALKAQVIAWAATPAGGSMTIAPQDVWICGFADDQTTGVRVAADQATSNPAFIDVPGMQFPVAPNSNYEFIFKGAYTAASATTGLQLSVNGPASPTFMRAIGTIFSSTTAPLVGAIGAYDAPIAGTASGGATALPFELAGTLSTGAAGGTLSLRFRTEVNGSAVTILRGSWGKLTGVN